MHFQIVSALSAVEPLLRGLAFANCRGFESVTATGGGASAKEWPTFDFLQEKS